MSKRDITPADIAAIERDAATKTVADISRDLKIDYFSVYRALQLLRKQGRCKVVRSERKHRVRDAVMAHVESKK